MNEIQKLREKLFDCIRRYDIVGANKIRSQLLDLEFDQAQENLKATQKLKDNGALVKMQILHSESYLLFSIATGKMSEVDDLMKENKIELPAITKAYKEFERASDRYYKVLSSAINQSETKNFFSDYDELSEKIKVLVKKFFGNPKNAIR